MSLFTNPHQWAASMVGTWPRFWLFAVGLSALLFMLADVAGHGSGIRAAWGFVLFIAAYQIGMLYALRRILTASDSVQRFDHWGGVKVKKVLNIASELVLAALPFLSAYYVCSSALSRIAPGEMKFWEPAFYSFLPMSFVLLGIIIYMTRSEIRELRGTIAELRPNGTKNLAA
jgi:hypothetical protein